MLLYAVVKYFTYAAWCYFGLQLLASRANLAEALKYGLIRWLLGLFFGLAVGLALGSVDPDNAARLYFLVYTPLRVVEWGIIAALVLRTAGASYGKLFQWRALLWIVGGIAMSFLSDLLSPEGLAGKFCAGRCLC